MFQNEMCKLHIRQHFRKATRAELVNWLSMYGHILVFLQ